MAEQYRNGQNKYPAPVSEAGLPSTEILYPVSDFDDSADLRDYIDVVLRHKWLVLTVLVGVFVTTLIVSLNMKPVFRASGRLELSPQEANITKFEDVAPSQLMTYEYMGTQVKLLQSASLARRVVEKLNLSEHPLFNPASRSRKVKRALCRSSKKA